MCATLEKIMAPELDARELRGELRGELKGELKGKVLAYAEMGISLEEIAKKVPLSVKEIEAIIARNQYNEYELCKNKNQEFLRQDMKRADNHKIICSKLNCCFYWMSLPVTALVTA